MKTLYIQITSSPAPEASADLVVYPADMSNYFCNYLEYELVDGLRMPDGTPCYKEMKPGSLLLAFATGHEEAYQSIPRQWENIQRKLLQEEPAPNTRYEVTLPKEYIEWLLSQEGYIYQKVGEKLAANNILSLSAEDLYEEFTVPCIHQLTDYLRKHPGEFDRFVFSEEGIKSSYHIVKTLHEADEKPVFYRLLVWQQEEKDIHEHESYIVEEFARIWRQEEKDTHEHEKWLRSNQEFTVNGVSFTMVYVQAGSFYMGSNDGFEDEKPVHLVTLNRDFYIGQFPVTQKLWKAVMGSDAPCSVKGENLPVTNITWDECQIFVRRLSELTGKDFHLPTEAQWEYAAKGGVHSKGFKYAGSDELFEVAWSMVENNEYKPHNVGEKHPNELGIYDMSGNIGEWCIDLFHNYPSSANPEIDPINHTHGTDRVYRGGVYMDPKSFDIGTDYPIGTPALFALLRLSSIRNSLNTAIASTKRYHISSRKHLNPNGRLSSVGLRLALFL